MKILELPVRPDQIKSALVEWVTLLSQGDFEAAQQFLCRPLERDWTPAMIRDAIAGYGDIEDREDNHRVMLLPGLEGRIQLEMFEPGNDPIAYVDIDLPLDSDWSDLSASFLILNEGDSAVFYLCNIRVM